MAGITAMGDLSHELETLVLQIDSGSVAGDDHAHAVMQASLDELARMRDLVSDGTLPAGARDLIAQIRGLGDTRQAPRCGGACRRAVAASAASPPSRRRAPADRSAAGSAASRLPAGSRAASLDLTAPCTVGKRAAAVSEDSVASLELSSAPVLPGRESAPAERVEMARVDADLLDTMLNNAGEVSIFRARLDQQVNSIDFNLAELARTVTRLKEQLRGLEIETEAQVLQSASGRRAAARRLRSARIGPVLRRCSSSRARSPKPRATLPAFRACSRP